jgi:hypothetical protein
VKKGCPSKEEAGSWLLLEKAVEGDPCSAGALLYSVMGQQVKVKS